MNDMQDFRDFIISSITLKSAAYKLQVYREISCVTVWKTATKAELLETIPLINIIPFQKFPNENGYSVDQMKEVMNEYAIKKELDSLLNLKEWAIKLVEQLPD